jgi:hypothetical protein
LPDAVLKAERDIIRYLLAHQDARDTIEGIEQWWLPRSRDYGWDAVNAALQHLQMRELIGVWKSASAKPVYGLRSAETHILEHYLHTLNSADEMEH